MAKSRYNRTPLLAFGAQFGTSTAIQTVRTAIKNGTLHLGKQIILRGTDRLDTIAGVEYGDGRYWWVLAAASNIGWGLQVPAGTIINVPVLSEVLGLVG